MPQKVVCYDKNGGHQRRSHGVWLTPDPDTVYTLCGATAPLNKNWLLEELSDIEEIDCLRCKQAVDPRTENQKR